MTKENTEGIALAPFDAELLKANAETALDVIARVGSRATELVEAWVAAKNAAAVAALAENDRTPAPARKAARRGLQVLKARGVPLPERSHVARIPADAVEGHEAWLLPPDGGGMSVVVIAARYKSGKYRMVQAVAREGVGLASVDGAEMSRAQLRNSFDDNAKRMGFAPVAVPVGWARARVAAAKLDNAKSGAVLPLGLDSHADLLGPVPGDTPPHPLDAVSLSLPPTDAAVSASAVLHAEPEFVTWLPSGQALQELIFDIGQKLRESGPEPKREITDPIVAAAIDAATDRFFEPDLRAILARRMKDAALSITAREGKKRAAEVMAVAQAILEAGLITSPPHEIPFLRTFFMKGLAHLAERTGGRLPIPDVGPTGGAPSSREGVPAAPSGEKTSPGGIILP